MQTDRPKPTTLSHLYWPMLKTLWAKLSLVIHRPRAPLAPTSKYRFGQFDTASSPPIFTSWPKLLLVLIPLLRWAHKVIWLCVRRKSRYLALIPSYELGKTLKLSESLMRFSTPRVGKASLSSSASPRFQKKHSSLIYGNCTCGLQYTCEPQPLTLQSKQRAPSLPAFKYKTTETVPSICTLVAHSMHKGQFSS